MISPLQVPLENSAVQTFDIFYKLHKVFNLKYEANIAPMMTFCEFFIYKLPIRSFRAGLKMTEIYNKMSRPL